MLIFFNNLSPSLSYQSSLGCACWCYFFNNLSPSLSYQSSLGCACWCYFFNNLSPLHFHSTSPLTELQPNHIPPHAPSRFLGCLSSGSSHFRDFTQHERRHTLVADKCFARRHIGARFLHSFPFGLNLEIQNIVW